MRLQSHQEGDRLSGREVESGKEKTENCLDRDERAMRPNPAFTGPWRLGLWHG